MGRAPGERRARGYPEPESGLPVGEPAPAVELASLEGESAELTASLHGETVVLFWNPQCGFCRQMHPDLIAWEKERTARAPELVIVSAGETDDVRAEGFSSTVLHDPDWAASSAFSAGGTPTAVRIDATSGSPRRSSPAPRPCWGCSRSPSKLADPGVTLPAQ